MGMAMALVLLLGDAEDAMGTLRHVADHGNRILADGEFAPFEGTAVADAVGELVRAAESGIEGMRAPVGMVESLLEWANDE